MNSTPPDGADHIPGQTDAVPGEVPPDPGTQEEKRRDTLPPPEWMSGPEPKSATSVTLTQLMSERPVARRSGPRAELAHLAGLVEAAQADRDLERERLAAVALARSLAARGSELDTACKLARRALLLADDADIRDELSGWFAGLGEPVVAAATLVPLLEGKLGQARAEILARVAVLRGRGADSGAAAAALDEAIVVSPSDPVPAELLGAIAAWAPGVVAPGRGARAYLEGAKRRLKRSERGAAFEDVLRAFELAPEEPQAADALVTVLQERGRVDAADEVLREHAVALARAVDGRETDAGNEIHRERMQSALVAGQWQRALGAALDAGLDGSLELDGALRAAQLSPGLAAPVDAGLDELLVHGGLEDVLLARLELLGVVLPGRDRAAALVALGRVAQRVGSLDVTLRAWVAAAAADPADGTALDLLDSLGDEPAVGRAMAEALVRIGDGDSGLVEARILALERLVTLAEGPQASPLLAAWAVRRVGELGGAGDAVAEAAERIAPRAQAQEHSLEDCERRLQSVSGDARMDVLRRLAGLLRQLPSQADRYVAVLNELLRTEPREPRWADELAWLEERRGGEALRRWLELRSTRSPRATERDMALVRLAAVTFAAGRGEEALELVAPRLEADGNHQLPWAMALTIATQVGRPRERARALLRLGASRVASLKSVLCAVAADALLRDDASDAAAMAAELAVQSDPRNSRAIATLAQAAARSQRPDAAELLEKAMGMIVPRAGLCEALSRAYERMGESGLALAWAQRRLVLRPGDPEAAGDLLRHLASSDDAVRISDALAWLLSQPQPLVQLSEPLGLALRALTRLNPTRGAALARRALDVVGPRPVELRESILEIAEDVTERGLAISTYERWLASGAEGAEAGDLLLEIARRRAVAGDVDGAARSLARAAIMKVDGERILEALERLPPTKGSDGEIALLRARAEAVSRAAEASALEKSLAWREYGAACWDLAADPDAATLSWERAAKHDPEAGFERLAQDLIAFGGKDDALRRLESAARRHRRDAPAARLLGLAARLALDGGKKDQALRLAEASLERDPSRADAIAVAERAAGADDAEALGRVYGLVADRALGCYGERAIYYRAARQFERRNDLERATRYAASAFESVPTAGVTFMMFLRVAERAGRTAELVAAIERVASRASSEPARAAWLQRAADIAGNTSEGKKQRAEILLRTLMFRADEATVQAVGDALGNLVEQNPEDTEILQMRFDRAVRQILPGLSDEQGAGVAIEAALVAINVFEASELAVPVVDRALSLSVRHGAYLRLVPVVGRLLNAPEEARGAYQRAMDAVRAMARPSEDGAPTREFLEFAAAFAQEFGEVDDCALALVRALQRQPDDAALKARAEAAAEASGDPDIEAMLLDAVAPEERADRALDLAEEAINVSDPGAAIELLERLPVVDLDPPRSARHRALMKLALRGLGRFDELAGVLREELEHSNLDDPTRIETTRALARLIVHRESKFAVELLVQLAHVHEGHSGIVTDLEEIAREAGDDPVRADALQRLIELTVDPGEKRRLLKELAPLLERMGDQDGAMVRWNDVLRDEPTDSEALLALERDAERRGDHELLATALARRAAAVDLVDEVRRIRLRRAMVLEQRLGRPDEARQELEYLLAVTGDHLSVLRVLADLLERLDQPERAAPLWFRGSSVAGQRTEAADLCRRAIACHVRAGNPEAARRVLEGMEAWADDALLARLRVEVERTGDPGPALAEALLRLGADDGASQEERVAWLMEAATTYRAIGQVDDALVAAAEATRIDGEDAGAQLLARSLEYQQRGPGTPDEARVTVAGLRGIHGVLTPEQKELRAYLVAEALDQAVAAGSGTRELQRVSEDVGTRPLIALGLADRLGDDDPERALELYEVALEGDLRGLHRRGAVAVRAVELALLQLREDLARGWLPLAEEDSAHRAYALELREKMRRAHPSIRPPATMAEGSAPERPIPTPPPAAAVPHFDDGFPRVSSVPPASPSSVPPRRASSMPPAAGPPDGLEAPEAPPSHDGVGRPPPANAVRPSTAQPIRAVTPAPPATRSRSVARSGSSEVPSSAAQLSTLQRNFEAGDTEAGFSLVEAFDRSGDVPEALATAKLLVKLLPGDTRAIDHLIRATRADHAHAHAAALTHVRQILAFEDAVDEPPPLTAQPEQPENVRALLLRGARGPAAEALGLVWEGASHVFRRDPSAYGVTGMERVPLGSPTPLARVFSQVARSLGMSGTPLFTRRAANEVQLSVALLQPPALIVSGIVDQETVDLRYHIGAMLLAALPEHVLLFASSEGDASVIFDGLALAFGPPQRGRRSGASVANLAEVLWESIPHRAQRRLRELCEEGDALRYDNAMGLARQATRRAGLFVAGNLATALRYTLDELGLSADSAAQLATLCREEPALRDLLELATSVEFAEARWQSSRSGARLPPARARL